METTFGCLIPEINEYAREGEYRVVQPEGLHVPLTDTKEGLMFSVGSKMLSKT